MARNKKCRCVNHCPCATSFKPTGINKCTCGLIELQSDEMETIKLVDFDGLDQEQTAQKMQVSRPTVQRIYKSARSKIADALVNGKIINFERGE